jgi:hypothetical protein
MAHIHIPDDIPVRYLDRSSTANLVCGGLVVAGLLAFFVTLSSNPAVAWQAWVINWLYFTSISLGAVMFGVATTIVKARWNWSIRRIGFLFAAFLPFSFLLFLPMLTLGEDFFPWIGMIAEGDYIVMRKAAYLNLPFLRARNVVGLLLLFGLVIYFAYLQIRPDLGLSKGHPEEDAGRAKWRERLSAGWQGQEVEEVRSWRRLGRLGPLVVLTYAIIMTIVAVDWAMSLDPHWFSTLFGWWFFMAAFWGGIAATALTMVWLRGKHPDFAKHMGRQQRHDIGKLTFGFTVFWTYLFWSQYIVIWYGKLPWEQHWMVVRLGQPWGPWALLTLFLCFIIPFATLISRQKIKPVVLGTATSVILVGLWLERFMLVAPSLRPDGPTLSVWEPAIGLLFLGVFLFSVRWALSTFPVIQVWRPPVEAEMVDLELAPEHRRTRSHQRV